VQRRLIVTGAIGLLLVAGVAAGVVIEPTLRPEPEPVRVPVLSTAAPVLPAPTREAVRQVAGLSDAFIAIADAVTPAVVRIQAERHPVSGQRARWLQGFFGGDSAGASYPEVAGGTGFVISTDGYILTNDHVIADAARIVVGLADKRVFDARVIGRDPSTDLAVIRVDADALPAADFGDSDAARVGEWVLAIGNPGFDDASTLDFTVTSGIISAKGRPLNVIGAGRDDPAGAEALYAIEDFIQTDAAINPGNSGGPLVNLRGAVIGVNTAIATSSGYHQGYGFAIPSNLALRVARDLIARGHVRRALLGVSINDAAAEDAELYGLPRIAGVIVEDFADDSPAARAGLERHDVIVAIDGTPVERVGHLQRLIALREPDDEVRVAVIRYGTPLEVVIRLTQAPLAATAAVPTAPRPTGTGAERLGLQREDLTPALARELGFARAGGALVTGVAELSPADRKRIDIDHRLTHIDRRPIDSAREARTLLRAARTGSIVSLVLETPDGRTYIANVRVP
jgi:serine protease Do